MGLHDWIVQELTATKSLAALIWLINQGRELEFRVNDTACFLSGSGSAQRVSLWVNQAEQSFESIEALIEQAAINDTPFLLAWKDAAVETLF